MARPERFEVEAFCGPFDKFALLICSGQAKSWAACRNPERSEGSMFCGRERSGVPGTRGVRVTGWGSGSHENVCPCWALLCATCVTRSC